VNLVRIYKRGLAWLGIMALLGNVMAGAFGYVPAKKMVPVVDEILGALIICTADGATDGSHGGGSPIHNPADHCPACMTLAKVALAAAIILLGVIAFPLPVAARPVPIRSRPLVPHLSLGGIGSRAPPLFA
jgi:Protein of unknown function (DUF2946)